jgi:hypothetical protein
MWGKADVWLVVRELIAETFPSSLEGDLGKLWTACWFTSFTGILAIDNVVEEAYCGVYSNDIIISTEAIMRIANLQCFM